MSEKTQAMRALQPQKDIRYQPFFNLMNLISDDGLLQYVDIGCGTGEQTAILFRFCADSLHGKAGYETASIIQRGI